MASDQFVMVSGVGRSLTRMLSVQGPCASRVPVRTTLILYGNDYAADERVVIKRGRPLIKIHQELLDNDRWPITGARSLIGGKRLSEDSAHSSANPPAIRFQNRHRRRHVEGPM